MEIARNGIFHVYHNRFFPKARPEPLFRYFSKETAFSSDSNALYHTIFQGRKAFVESHDPSL
jgi:hypothetical protein